ncbi:hypothetical protein [Burkholderia pseudomallei]|uniref:hypothetical protein n=1 Tax=Burkholderia pseudomallei TaxID=28450 RepID=UPI0005E9A521|nr:hypothetical protein [Burkholderia pseudomallei]CAJ3337790.1 Uncharacterised protein [Burkholderia pseudomallei]CAJ3865015.1 Uncharacterised protein [Burkholderia pseudomallei]CAJ3895437.1 Uncharacterised protein [Burkholderia pseudomallei]CAJ5634046.1 Uncharacterised protein [Burkholderia pseudomallei]CAJ7000636.1 Uncharacterised protein [Burkholderia pseudomallei]
MNFEYTFHIKPTEDGRCIVETGEYWEPLVLVGVERDADGKERHIVEPEAFLSNARRLAEQLPS